MRDAEDVALSIDARSKEAERKLVDEVARLTSRLFELRHEVAVADRSGWKQAFRFAQGRRRINH